MIDQVASAPPGWYRLSDGTMRYWDGLRWLEPVAGQPPTTEQLAQPAQVAREVTAQPAQVATRRAKEPLSRGLKVWIAMLVLFALPLVVLQVGAAIAYMASPPVTAIDAETEALLRDIDLGAPKDYGYGNLAVPVSVTNSGEQSADYYVVIYSTTPDGVSIDGSNWITFEGVPPGATVEAPVLFHPFLSDVEIFVKEATRTESGEAAPVAAVGTTTPAGLNSVGPSHTSRGTP